MSNPSAEALMMRSMESARAARFSEAVDLLRQAMAIDSTVTTGQHTNLAEMLNRNADLENIARLAPARLNTLVTCGWLNSVFSGRPVNAQGLPIPWFTYSAIDFLEPKIRSDWTVLEWGCGNSTLWWAPRVKHVWSVEHNPDWLTEIAAEAPKNVSLSLRQDLNQYASLDELMDAGPFDAVVIDGQERNRCARLAAACVKPDGIIILDNSDRASLRDGMDYLMANGWKRIDFFGLVPIYLYRTCTSIFFQNAAIFSDAKLPCDHQSCLGPTLSQVLGE